MLHYTTGDATQPLFPSKNGLLFHSRKFWVCNAVCCRYQRTRSPLDLGALAQCLHQLPQVDYVQMPKIGTGLGVTDWDLTAAVIDDWATDAGVGVYVVELVAGL